ncbi:MAG: DegT/DnrJ/EryC1/StrS family aminotransferase [Bacteroidales bacterium]|nr:DegT/DnrJ/EryC1/StrS family aminotransferase [Bacteroidales bacterium]
MKADQYRQMIAGVLGNDLIYFYWKGRVALYALLKAMKVAPGDEVIVPGFTCVVVSNAIKYTGARPVYVDVEKDTMNPAPESFYRAVTGKTKVVLVQNTFGLSTAVDEISAFARAQNIFTIEDCTHGFGGLFKGKPNGSYCDAAFFSTQWNKPFSTGIGGFASVNNHELIPGLEKVNRDLIHPSLKDRMVLAMLLFSRDHILTDSNYWTLRSLYRFLSRNDLVIGSSQGGELTGTEMPPGYFKSISGVQVKKGIRSLGDFAALLERRKENGGIYTRLLADHGKYHVGWKLHPDHCFLKYPALVKNRDDFEEKARKKKIELGDWFCSPVYPVRNNWELWDLDPAKIPNALYLSEHIVNFPAETQYPEKVVKFAEKFMDEIL